MSTTKVEMRLALEKSYKALAPFSDRFRWEFDNHLSHLRCVMDIAATMPKRPTIIDVGCHIGILALAMRLLGHDAAGNDKYLFQPPEQGNSYGYSAEDLRDLRRVWSRHGLTIDSVDVVRETPTKQYDLVLSIATIEHQPFPKPFLGNIAGFARSGGYIYIATPNVAKLANRVRLVLGRPPLSNLAEFYVNAERFTGHWREYTPSELGIMGRLSGLEVVWAKALQLEPVNLHMGTPQKWPRSLARLLAHVIPGTGDSAIALLRKPD